MVHRSDQQLISLTFLKADVGETTGIHTIFFHPFLRLLPLNIFFSRISVIFFVCALGFVDARKPYRIGAVIQQTLDTWETLNLLISISPTVHLPRPLILRKQFQTKKIFLGKKIISHTDLDTHRQAHKKDSKINLKKINFYFYILSFCTAYK